MAKVLLPDQPLLQCQKNGIDSQFTQGQQAEATIAHMYDQGAIGAQGGHRHSGSPSIRVVEPATNAVNQQCSRPIFVNNYPGQCQDNPGIDYQFTQGQNEVAIGYDQGAIGAQGGHGHSGSPSRRVVEPATNAVNQQCSRPIFVNNYPGQAPINSQPMQIAAQQRMIQTRDIGDKPSNYLVFSVFNLFCCCFILGIFALIYSMQVDSAWVNGQYKESRQSSRMAKLLNIISIIISGVIWFDMLLYVMYYVFYLFIGLLIVVTQGDN